MPNEGCERSLALRRAEEAIYRVGNQGIESFRQKDRNRTDLWKVSHRKRRRGNVNSATCRMTPKLSGLITEDMLTPSP